MRSISNVVDVTNFVMLETGQPLHAFDYHLIAKGQDGKPAIVIRRAADGEKFTTLDGQQRTLTNQMLLIADESKAIALAGVMGGQNSEINDRTRDVLIESAYFKPQNIRATSKKLDLRTEASYRYERGGDIGICDWASRRAAQLMLQTAGGQLAGGIVDAYPHPARPKEITLRHHKVCELLGIKISPAQDRKHLRQLGLKRSPRRGPGRGCWMVTFASDVSRGPEARDGFDRRNHAAARRGTTSPSSRRAARPARMSLTRCSTSWRRRGAF